MPDSPTFDGEIDSTIEAFAAFVRATPNDPNHVVREGSNLTGAELHFVQRAFEDMMVDYEVLLPPAAEFEADPKNPLDCA